MFRRAVFVAVALALAAAGRAPQTSSDGQAAAPATEQQPAPTQVAAATPAAGTDAATPTIAAHHPSTRERVEAQKLFVQGAKDIDRDRVRAAMDEFPRAAKLDPGGRR